MASSRNSGRSFTGMVTYLLYFELWALDGHSYVLQLQCDRFGDEPVRGRFVDPTNYACVTEAWPRGNSTFGGWFKWDTRESIHFAGRATARCRAPFRMARSQLLEA